MVRGGVVRTFALPSSKGCGRVPQKEPCWGEMNHVEIHFPLWPVEYGPQEQSSSKPARASVSHLYPEDCLTMWPRGFSGKGTPDHQLQQSDLLRARHTGLHT